MFELLIIVTRSYYDVIKTFIEWHPLYCVAVGSHSYLNIYSTGQRWTMRMRNLPGEQHLFKLTSNCTEMQIPDRIRLLPTEKYKNDMFSVFTFYSYCSRLVLLSESLSLCLRQNNNVGKVSKSVQ